MELDGCLKSDKLIKNNENGWNMKEFQEGKSKHYQNVENFTRSDQYFSSEVGDWPYKEWNKGIWLNENWDSDYRVLKTHIL